MADAANAANAANKSFSAKISFCPHLGLYHYVQAGGTEYFFTSDKLVETIQSYVDGGDVERAEFMAGLTAFARRFPHHVLVFDKDGKVDLKELVAAPAPAEEPEDGRG